MAAAIFLCRLSILGTPRWSFWVPRVEWDQRLLKETHLFMNTLIFIVVLIAITYALTSKPKKEIPRKKAGSPKSGPFQNTGSSASSGPLIDKGDMLRCHNCGAFFPSGRAVRSQVQDVELHFCSQNCKVHFKVD